MKESKLIEIQNVYFEGAFYYFIKENKMFLLDSKNNFIALFSLNLKQTEEKIVKQLKRAKTFDELKDILKVKEIIVSKNKRDLEYICSFSMEFVEEDILQIGKNYLIMEI